ncbi:MAG: SEC59/DGK1/VTE5 family protein [Leptolyngbyaceae cyanobacterium bins.349]|nr:SEC59/DGK1/VTE5 family protein [Leptolyngbyaceae cyanobacterium bins.349]
MNVLSWFEVPVPLWLQVGVVLVWLGWVGLTAEWLHRSQVASPEVVRKVVHIGVGNVILLAWWLQTPAWLGVGASVVFSAIAFLSYRFPILPSINGVGRKSLGTFFYAVSIGILVGYFWTVQQPHFAVLGVLVMTWGDGLAAVIGQKFGQHPYLLWDMKKSWEGSLTMALVSFLVSSLILVSVQGMGWQTWMIAVAVAAIATALEAFSKFGIDNLTVPLSSAAVALILSSWLGMG